MSDTNNPFEADTNPEFDYSTYTLDEMLDAYESIDKTVFPVRAEALRKLILLRQSAISSTKYDKGEILSVAKVKFHGRGNEYFAIWIVNLLLSIVTLGIYSAWATVRTHRYFYSNTEIAGHRLYYLAEPMQILRGRIIAVLLLAGYLIISNFSPVAGLIVILFIALLTPFVICLGVRFRMRMMAYRNVRFNFKMRFGRAFFIFLFLPLVALCTFYLAMPWVLKKIDEFLYENMEYGNKNFIPELAASEYYVAAIISGVIAGIGMLIIGFSVAIMMGVGEFDPESMSAGYMFTMFIVAFMYILIIVAATSYYKAHIRNHVYNNTKIEGVASFESNVEFIPLMVLNATNYGLLIFTLGLAIPWVKVRTARFYAEATTVTVLVGINEVVAENENQDSAVADEVIGAFNIDISIG
nr:YjgN family protein [uncultured Glaciecola sp.]